MLSCLARSISQRYRPCNPAPKGLQTISYRYGIAVESPISQKYLWGRQSGRRSSKGTSLKIRVKLVWLFCLRPYWTRLWIIQELISSKVTPLCIGLRCLDFFMLSLVSNAMLRMGYSLTSIHPEFLDLVPRGILFTEIGVHNAKYLKSSKIGHVLLAFRPQSCLGPRY